MTSNDADVVSLDAALRSLKSEVDSLQVHVLGLSAPWYRQMATIIAVMSFALSLLATVGAEFRVRQQEVFASRAELRQLIQRMNALPREAFELGKKYQEQNDLMSLASLTQYIRNENNLLAGQATGLLESLSEYATPDEYFAVAAALSQFDTRRAITLLEQLRPRLEGIANPGGAELDAQIQLFRTLATYNIGSGDFLPGRQYFQRALAVARAATVPNESLRDRNLADTELYWVRAEAAAGNCDIAHGHLRAASDHLDRVPNAGKDPQIVAALDAYRTTVQQCRSGPNIQTTTPAGEGSDGAGGAWRAVDAQAPSPPRSGGLAEPRF